MIKPNFLQYSKVIRRLFLYMAVFLVLTSSCKRGTGIPGKEGKELFDGIGATEKLEISRIRNTYFSIPSPSEILGAIDMEDLTYIPGLTNPVAGKEYYENTREKSLNLGVYLTDLAYSFTMGRHEEAVDYLEVLRRLAEEVRIGEALSGVLIDRAEGNMDNPDSLTLISNEAFVNLVGLCEKQDRGNTLVLITSGVLVESLFLAVNHAQDAADASKLYRHLAEQRFALDNLWELASSLSEDPLVSGVLSDLEPVEKVYSKLKTESGAVTVRKESGGRLVIGAQNPPVLTEEEFAELKQAVTALRENIVSRN